LDFGSKAAALPEEREVDDGLQATIALYSQKPRAMAHAGQSTRTGTARLDALLNSAVAGALNVRLAAAVSLWLKAQVKTAVTAGLD